MFHPELGDFELGKVQKRGFKLVRHLHEGLHSNIYLFHKLSVTDIVEEEKKDGEGEKKDVDEGKDKKQEKKSNEEIVEPQTLVCKMVDTGKMPKTIADKFFVRELDLLKKIVHPDIIYVHSIFRLSTKYFIFMRFAEMGDLAGYLRSRGCGVKEKLAKVWCRQLTAALQYLHILAIAHRDLKCDNILVTANHNLKITDFGFSRVMINVKGKEVHSSTFCGSIGYAAPEIIRGTRYYPRVTDAWSLGIVLYAILNGCLPFKTDNLPRLYADQVAMNYSFKRDVEIRISNLAVELVGGLLQPEPGERSTLEMVLRSRWLRSTQRQLTEREQQALDLAKTSAPIIKRQDSCISIATVN